MAVTVNASTEDVRTGTTSPQTFSHAGASSGVKGVVVAIVHGASATDHVSAVSYGGTALQRIVRTTDTVTEPGAAELWFLGASVPQGTQTVSYTPGTTTDDIHCVVTTFLADTDLEIVDFDSVSADASGGTLANPSLTLSNLYGESSMAYAALYGGGASPGSFTPNANCTTVHDHDLGQFYSEVIVQTTASTGASFEIGGTSNADDVAFVAVLVAEKQAPKTITPDAGVLALSGYAPSPSVESPNKTCSPDHGEIRFEGFAASLAISIGVAAGALSFTGHAPTPSVEAGSLGVEGTGLLLAIASLTGTASYTSAPDAGALAFTGHEPTTNLFYVLNPETATLTILGHEPTVTQGLSTEQFAYPSVGALALAGYAPAPSVVTQGGGGGPSMLLALGLNLEVTPGVASPEAGSLVLQGHAPSLLRDTFPDAGSLTLQGYAPTALAGLNIQTDVGALTLTGYAPATSFLLTASPSAGAMTLTGYAPSAQPSQGARAYGPLAILGLNLDPLVGSEITQRPSSAALTLTGYAPTASLSNVYDSPWDELVSQSASTDTGTLHGYKNAATVQPVTWPSAGSLTLQGYAPVVTDSIIVYPVHIGLLFVGRAPTVDRGTYPNNGGLTLAGYAPSLTVAEPLARPGSGSLVFTTHAPSIQRGYSNTYGTLVSLRASIFKYEDYFGSGDFYTLPAKLNADILTGRSGSGVLTSGSATVFEKGWNIQSTDSQDWTCQDSASDTWTNVTDSTEEWINV